MKYIFYSIIVILLLSIGCKKEPTIFTIKGKVVNKQLQENLSGVKVYLDAKKIENGVYNSSFVNIENTVTGGDGSFNIEIKESQVSEYRFRLSETGYFNIEEEVSVDDVHSKGGYNKNFELIQESKIELNVKNTMPQGADDKITYRYTNIEVKCNGCCNNLVIVGEGYDYEAHHEGRVSVINGYILIGLFLKEAVK